MGKGRWMKLHWMTLATGLAIAVTPGARAQGAAAPPPDQAAHVAEFLDIYDKGCLEAFDHNDLAGFVARSGGEKLSRGELARHYLTGKDGPENGWSIKGESGTYILMVGKTNCSVVTRGPADMAALEPYRALAEGMTNRWTNLKMSVFYRGSLDIISKRPGYLEVWEGSPSLVSLSYAVVQSPGEESEYHLGYAPPPIEQISP